jgi:hypothetical protein
MELLLNLAWVMLALPGYWLWRRDAQVRRGRSFRSGQCLLSLGCMLVLLFPVISATDDLHVMRAEMEDSAISKRAVRQAGSDKNSAWVNRLQAPPATVANAAWMPVLQVGLHDNLAPFSPLVAGLRILYAGRAPPVSLLG